MSLERDIAMLSVVPFFSGFDDEHLRLLAFSADARSLAAEMVLYEKGQALRSAYVITEGLLTASDGEDSRDLKPGTLIGERALIVPARAMETVRVAEPARALQFKRTVFRRFLDEYPQMAATIRARLASRVVRSAADYSRIAHRLGAIGD